MATMGSFEAVFVLKDKISKTLGTIDKNLSTFDGKLKGASVRLEHLQKKMENISKFGNKIKDVGKGLTVGVTLPVVAMGGAMVKAAADMESMQQQLSTMLGSELEGAKMFDEIKTMASKTPFGTKDLMAATNTMLGFGIEQKKVLPLMRQLGDISGGNAERFQSLALAFSQVSSAGKLQGQDLMQMINAGFNPLEAISKRTGKSIGVLKDEMSKGKITIQMVEQAMKDATSEGGRFFNMMEKQSKTALGQWSTFQDNLNSVLADFGKIILPYAIKGLQKLSKTLEWFNSLSPGAKKTILVIAGIAAAIGPLLIVLGSLLIFLAQLPKNLLLARMGFDVLTKGILGFGKNLIWLATNPITWIVAGVLGVIAVIVLLIKNWNKVKEVAINVGQAIAQWWGGLMNNLSTWIGNLIGWLDGLIEKLGFVANFIPGLNAIKLAKDVAGVINNSRTTNNTTTTTNSNNTTTTNITNNYNPTPQQMGFGQAQYATGS